MRPRLLLRSTLSAATIVALALSACPALAHEGAGYDVPHPAWQNGPPQPYSQHPMMEPDAREAWLAECRHRLSMHGNRWDRDDREREMDQCEAYLDSYYAYYRSYQDRPYPAYAYAAPCCQPMMMVPAAPEPRTEPECTETVEYEYVDVPARPKARPAPDKRIKVVPDKRIPIK